MEDSVANSDVVLLVRVLKHLRHCQIAGISLNSTYQVQRETLAWLVLARYGNNGGDWTTRSQVLPVSVADPRTKFTD